MINKISINNNISFKNNNKINPQYETYKKASQNDNDTYSKSSVIGGVAGLVHYALKKNLNKAFNFGIGTYLLSSIAIAVVNTVKDKKEAQANYQKYENNATVKNGMDKFIESLSTPTYVDLGSEEKNEKYYKMAKEMNIDTNKISLISLGVGVLVGTLTGIVALAKKMPDKLDKILTATLVSTATSLFAGNLALIPKRTEIYNKQGENK